MSAVNKIRQILAEAGPDSIPGRLEPKGPVQDLGGPVVTPGTSNGADYAKANPAKSAALPKQGGQTNPVGAPNPTKYKKDSDVIGLGKKEIGEDEEVSEDEISEDSELPQWLKDRLYEASLEEDEEVEEEEEELPEEEIEEDEEVSESDDDDDDEDDKKDKKKFSFKKEGEEVVAETFKIAKPTLTNEDANALFSGSKLTEKAKKQILTVFEAVVAREVNAQLQIIGERYNQELTSEVDAMTEALAEQVELYLDSVTESWVENNALAIEQGIRTQLAESLLSEMKDVFTRHYIEIPENKIDIVDTLAEKVEELEEDLNDSLKITARLNEQVINFHKQEIIRNATAGMVDLTAEKIAKLAEGVEFRSTEDFASKVETIKEHYSGTTQKPGKSVTLTEDSGNNFQNGGSYEENMATFMRTTVKNR